MYKRTLQGYKKALGLEHILTVIAGELEGSWRAGGQQEGLQYNGEAA
jgi:hypothetical protein